MKWKILSSQYLFSDLWFKVRKDKCETPRGKIVDPYYVYEFPTWVTSLALTEDGKVILERQYRHALGEICIEIPGGCVDDTDLNLEEAIKRELLEETGYKFENWRLLQVTQPHSKLEWFIHIFLATSGQKVQEPQLEAGERIKVNLLDFNMVKEKVVSEEGYLGESRAIFEKVNSLEELLKLPAYEGKKG